MNWLHGESWFPAIAARSIESGATTEETVSQRYTYSIDAVSKRYAYQLCRAYRLSPDSFVVLGFLFDKLHRQHNIGLYKCFRQFDRASQQ